MTFKGEVGAEYLDSIKTGHTVGDTYRIIEAGKLEGVALPFGTFVEWKGTYWEVKKDMQYAVSKTGESLDQAVADVLDDHASVSVEEELTVPAAEAANYTVDNYFEQNGEIWKCTDKTNNGDGTWTVEANKVNGVVPVLNTLVETDKMQVIAAALNDLDARLKAVEESISSVNIGSRVADEFDTQSLKVGGEDINTIIQNAIGG